MTEIGITAANGTLSQENLREIAAFIEPTARLSPVAIPGRTNVDSPLVVLSGSAVLPFSFAGKQFRSIDHFFEVSARIPEHDALAAHHLNRHTSKSARRRCEQHSDVYRADFHDVRDDLKAFAVAMTALEHRKFCELLLSTGDKTLCFIKPEAHFGTGTMEAEKFQPGENRYGRILMECRTALQSNALFDLRDKHLVEIEDKTQQAHGRSFTESLMMLRA